MLLQGLDARLTLQPLTSRLRSATAWQAVLSPSQKGEARKTSEVEATVWHLRADDAKHRKAFQVEQ